MRDAAGDGGEIYTPRPVVRLMVMVTNPRLGEVMEDPACGAPRGAIKQYLKGKEEFRKVDSKPQYC
jgi:type I restriction enzyme M protein